MVRPLRNREEKEVRKILFDTWGTKGPEDIVFCEGPENRLSIVKRTVFDLPLDSLKINSLGIYFGEHKNGELRLSIEASQIIGKDATKGIISVSDDQIHKWLRGEDIAYDDAPQGFLIVKNGSDFCGCARFKDGRLLNFVPKVRRISSKDSPG